jgi:hypothetical protein
MLDDPSTRGLLRVDTVEKVGCMLHALMVRHQYNCQTSSVKVRRQKRYTLPVALTVAKVES